MTRRRDLLHSENHLGSFFSREAAFLYNNFIIIAILAVVFLFTYYPIFSELVTGEKGFVGAPVYEQALAPLFAALLLLMGVAPLTMWYRTNVQRLQKAILWPAAAALVFVVVLFFLGVQYWAALLGLWIVTFSALLTLIEFWKGTRARMKRGEPVWTAYVNLMARNHRRYGGYWIHLGVLVMAFGIIGTELYQQQTQMHISSGESIRLGNYEMVFNGARRYAGPDDLLVTEANLDVFYNGRFVTTLTPKSELYTRTGQPMTIPDARSTIAEDFYVLLVNWEPTTANEATFRVYLNPLINWVWAGGLIFVLGTLIAAWPDRRHAAVLEARHERAALGAAGD
ncbi:MAG: hypothetical protein IPM39_06180 [Chloroflexi bacterium]|nr:hypothetical protein [Chloroflexota bacterium]